MNEFRERVKKDYFRNWLTLDNVKTKLFKEKDISKWKLDENSIEVKDSFLEDSQFKEDKEASYDLMLPLETQTVYNKREFLGYLNAQLRDEGMWAMETKTERYWSSILSLVIKTQENNVAWNKTLNDMKNRLVALKQ